MKTLLPTILILVAAVPALGQQGGGLLWLSGEIRGQIAVVQAHAEATLRHCDDADDVFDELRELCRDMDRFEACLQQPIRSRSQLRHLIRRARDVDDQVCELREEIEEALEDLREDAPRFGRRGGPPIFAIQPAGYHAVRQQRAASSIHLALRGRYGTTLRVGFGPEIGIHRVGLATVPPIAEPLPVPGYHPGVIGQGGPHFGGLRGGHGVIGCDLIDSVERLRGLTRQLRRIVGG